MRLQAKLDMPVDHMDNFGLNLRPIGHARQKGARDVHGIALIAFWRAIQHQDFQSPCPFDG